MKHIDPDVRAVLVNRLLERRAAGELRSAEVPRRKARARYEITQVDRDGYAKRRGNVAALHRERLAAGEPGVPSLRRFQEAFARDMTPAERAAAVEGVEGQRRHQLYLRWAPDRRNGLWESDHKVHTEDYARETHLLTDHVTQPDEVDRWLQAHTQRQYRLTDPQPLELSAVISEAALRRCAAHPTLARNQLNHLIRHTELPNVQMRTLPFSAGVHPGMSGSFFLLSFPDGVLPDLCYQDYAMGGQVIDTPAIVTRFDKIHTALRDQALGAGESLAMISDLLTPARPDTPPTTS